jgi:CubicO group peptidase (beta-lactamase class C family)
MNSDNVRDAMERAIGMGEVGLQVAAYLNGEQILDESVGEATPGGSRVQHDTLFSVFSVTKAIVATTLHVQAERGHIEYSRLVTDYWPEFGKNGKATTTVADVLAHRAGIPQMPAGVTPQLMTNWDWMIEQIEEFAPVFVPERPTRITNWCGGGWLANSFDVPTPRIGQLRSTSPRKSANRSVLRSSFLVCRPTN